MKKAIRELGTRFAFALLLALTLYAGGQMTGPDNAYAAIDPTSCTDMANYCPGIDPNADVGPNSCNAPNACQDFSGVVGSGSCNVGVACVGATATIGNNSCNTGSGACQYAGYDGGDVEIGDNSCNEANACGFTSYEGGSASIGDGSCNANNACSFSGQSSSIEIGDASCNFPNSCQFVPNAPDVETVIGVDSCGGDHACQFFSGQSIGNGSCNAENACASAGGDGGEATIGDDSCSQFQSCYQVGYSGEATVGDGSCIEVRSCETAGYDGSAAIGDGSCNDQYACYAVGWGGDGTIGNQSCNSFEACYGVGASSGPGSVGDGSCNGIRACKFFAYQGPSGSIGNVSCNSEGACIQSSGDIGDGSCNGIENCFGDVQDVGDCENNNNVPPGCNVEVTKTANPTSIPETGGTPVTYTVRIDFLEDEDVNFIEDDQFAGLGVNEGAYCTLYEDDGTNLGPISLPSMFIIDQYIVCTYTYEPPAGEAGTYHINVVTVNVGHPDCPEPVPESIAPANHECDEQAGTAAILPGEDPGTNDVTAEARVLYLKVEPEPTPEPTPDNRRDPVRPRPPNIGAGLSGLFNGMPTPLPTAPSAVAPATSTVIRPPSTGDGGLAIGSGVVDRGFLIGAVAVLTLTGIAIARQRRA